MYLGWDVLSDLRGARTSVEKRKKNQNSVHVNEHLLIVQALGKTLRGGYLILSYQQS